MIIEDRISKYFIVSITLQYLSLIFFSRQTLIWFCSIIANGCQSNYVARLPVTSAYEYKAQLDRVFGRSNFSVFFVSAMPFTLYMKII